MWGQCEAWNDFRNDLQDITVDILWRRDAILITLFALRFEQIFKVGLKGMTVK